MIRKGIIKNCMFCKKEFYVKKCLINKRYYCSKICFWDSLKGKNLSPNTQFKKGQKSWNEGTKGVMKSNVTSFKKGVSHPFYKGRIIHQGYVMLHRPEHPFCDRNGYVKEHRLIMEKELKRFLNPKEVVHHINEIRNDNRIENLLLFKSVSDHQKHHCPNGFHPNREIK